MLKNKTAIGYSSSLNNRCEKTVRGGSTIWTSDRELIDKTYIVIPTSTGVPETEIGVCNCPERVAGVEVPARTGVSTACSMRGSHSYSGLMGYTGKWTRVTENELMVLIREENNIADGVKPEKGV